MDSSDKFDSGVRRTRQYKVRVNTSKQNGAEKQKVTINSMVKNPIKSNVKCEPDIDEDRSIEIREPVVIRGTSRKRARTARAESEQSDLLNDFPLNQGSSDRENRKAADIELTNVLSNVSLNRNRVKCEVSSDKEEVQRKQEPFNETAIVNQAETSEEDQITCEVLRRDRFRTFNGFNQSSDAPRNQCLVLEPPTKQPKMKFDFHEELETRMPAEKVVNQQSQGLSDVSSNFYDSGLGSAEMISNKVPCVYFMDSNDRNNNFSSVQQNITTKCGQKVISLEVLKLGTNKRSQPVKNGNEANEATCEIVYDKNTSNRLNQNNNLSVNNWTKTIQNTSAKLPLLVAQPIKKVFLVQLDPESVSKILTGSSLKFRYPIVNQHKSTPDNRSNSGSKETEDNCAVRSERMPMNLPTPQPDVAEPNRSAEESSSVCVPEREVLPEVDDIGRSPFLFVAVDGS